MTGRSLHMDAPRAPLRGSHRVACLVIGVLCTLGALSGVMLRSTDALHRHNPAVASSTQLGDHASSARTDHHPVATAAVTAAQSQGWTAPVATEAAFVVGGTVDSVRTRGPPALA